MATTTVTTTTEEDARIRAAFGDKLRLPGNATQTQIKAELRQYIKQVVRDYETRNAVQSAVATVTEIDPQ